MEAAGSLLLGEGDVGPVGIERPRGASPFLMVCDHAGNRIPRRLSDLGLPQEHLARHIGWDLGALGVALRLSQQLDATLIHQRYSRLVIDCNRPIEAETSIPKVSDGTVIPGNASLAPADSALRVGEIYSPYHDAIVAALEQRAAARRLTILVAMHSFTPQLEARPAPRPWQIGVLFNRDSRLGLALVETLRREGDLQVGVNEPYSVSDLSDYAIPVHGEQRGLPHVMIELRQDLIASPDQQAGWALRLARTLPLAAVSLIREFGG